VLVKERGHRTRRAAGDLPEGVGRVVVLAGEDRDEENAKMIARGSAHGAESWSDQEIREAIEDGDTTVTLADATVFPPGSPRYEVPLLRIRLAQVAGWWLVPTDAEGKASFTHPSSG
jgi:hypothetical protein